MQQSYVRRVYDDVSADGMSLALFAFFVTSRLVTDFVLSVRPYFVRTSSVLRSVEPRAAAFSCWLFDFFEALYLLIRSSSCSFNEHRHSVFCCIVLFFLSAHTSFYNGGEFSSKILVQRDVQQGRAGRSVAFAISSP